jgi:hypothetical protein
MRCAEKVAAAYALGHHDALDAAREAVAALLAYDSPYGPLIRSDATLAAIDALREISND